MLVVVGAVLAAGATLVALASVLVLSQSSGSGVTMLLAGSAVLLLSVTVGLFGLILLVAGVVAGRRGARPGR
jgi:hypothetical protein